MENLRKEFNRLMSQAGKENEGKVLEEFAKKYENDPVAKAKISNLIKDGIAASGKRIENLSVKLQLQEASEMLNLSYIATHYFQKTKSWLSQRINSHIVNGKPAKFTEDEMKTFNLALKDMGKKIGSISVH